jgi:hypothetical protein
MRRRWPLAPTKASDRRRADQHAAMPDRCRPTPAIARIDDRSGGVDKSAESEQRQRGRCDRGDRVLAGGEDEPADREIEADKGTVVGAEQRELQEHAERGQRPYPLENAEAKRPAQIVAGEGCIGAGDQQKDRGVIKVAQQRTAARSRQRMIKEGAKRARRQRRAVDQDGERPPSIGAHGGAMGEHG